MVKVLCLFVLFTILKTSSCANILAVFPTPSYSHQQPSLGLSRALARRGHNVTMITANPGLETVKNHNEIDVHFMYDVWKEFQKDSKFDIQKRRSPFEVLPNFDFVFALLADKLLASEAIQNIVRSPDTKFDLLVYEGIYPSVLGLGKRFGNIPTVAAFTVPSYFTVETAFGNPIFPSYMPSTLTDSTDRMSFTERVNNIVLYAYQQYLQDYHGYPLQDASMRKYISSDLPPIHELEKNNSLLLLAGDVTESYPNPHQPNTIMVGTLHINQRKPLPDHLKSWMDGADAGVIYFSLGSNMQGTSVPEKVRNAFIRVFEKFPKHRVIWKWESDTPFPGKPDNVLLTKWIPQQDLLAHPKVRLFIMQGGHQSRQEATYFGVPLLVIPLFWDQDFNAKKIVTEGAGLSILIYDITFDSLYQKVNALLTDPSYKQNMNRLSAISRDKPMDGPATAAWWIEYVIRHKGAPHLRPAVHSLNWFQLYCLDILALFIFILASLLYTIYFIIKLVVRAIFPTTKTTKKVKVK